jgi:hypothetical protein
MTGAMYSITVDDLYDRMNDEGMTISEFLALPVGVPVDVAFWDRNALDHVSVIHPAPDPRSRPRYFHEALEGGALVPYAAEDFLRGVHGRLTRIDDPYSLRADMEFDIEWPSPPFTGPLVVEGRTVDLNFAPAYWYPLTGQGFIPSAVNAGPYAEGFPLPNWDHHWTEYSGDTMVGYRGPIVTWDKVSSIPPVLWWRPGGAPTRTRSGRLVVPPDRWVPS